MFVSQSSKDEELVTCLQGSVSMTDRSDVREGAQAACVLFQVFDALPLIYTMFHIICK